MKSNEHETSLFNVFDEANYLLMVISFEGETNLKEYLELNPLLPVENASKNNFKIKKKRLIAYYIARALCRCHSLGVVHRDIKLENIMITEKGNIRRIDFGYGAILKNSTDRFIRYCGTPYYMPPEIILKKEYDGRLVLSLIIKREEN